MIQVVRATICSSIMTFKPRPSQMVLHSTVLNSLQELLRKAVRKNLPLEAKRAIELGAPINRRDVDARDGHNDYHLVRATYYRCNEIAKMILDAGGDPEVTCKHGHTPLIAAAERHNPELVGDLIKASANVNKIDLDGFSALMGAGMTRDVPTIRLLIDAGARLDIVNNEGDTALNICVRWAESSRSFNFARELEAIELLIDPSCVDLPNSEGVTPLMTACRKRSFEAIRLLLGANADTKMVNKVGQTALDILLEEKYKLDVLVERQDKIIEMLERAPKDMSRNRVIREYKSEICRLDHAIFENDLKKVKMYIAEGDDIHQVTVAGSLLSVAAYRGHVEIVEAFLDAGVDVHQEFRGDTAPRATRWWRDVRNNELTEIKKIIELFSMESPSTTAGSKGGIA